MENCRYEEGGRVSDLVDALARNGVDPSDVGLVAALSLYAGASERVGDLLGTKSLFTRVRNNMKIGLQVTSLFFFLL